MPFVAQTNLKEFLWIGLSVNLNGERHVFDSRIALVRATHTMSTGSSPPQICSTFFPKMPVPPLRVFLKISFLRNRSAGKSSSNLLQEPNGIACSEHWGGCMCPL